MPKSRKQKVNKQEKSIRVPYEHVIVKIFSLLVIGIATFFAAWFALHGDIIFHTDIARDFLLVEDVVKHKPFTLIGPRSGGIPGVFHGPLWIYVNVPAFLLGGGNPAVVSWFWVLLYAVNVFIVYKVGTRLFDERVGYLAAAFTAVASAFSTSSLFNPFGAVMLAPVFFLLLYDYINTNSWKSLIWSLFVLGLMIQFQMAFAGPVLVLLIPLILAKIIKHKTFKHILCFLILLIPLSTFILFDLKHQFLQTKSVINYLTGKETSGQVDKPISVILHDRIHSMQTDGVGFITEGNMWMFYVALAFFVFAAYRAWQEKKYSMFHLYLLFTYLYVGYWLVTVLYKGTIWGYYYWPFLSLVCLMFASTLQFVPKLLFYPVFVAFIFFNLNMQKQMYFKPVSYFGNDGGSWRFHLRMARTAFQDAPSQFGFYVFTDDQFGYSSKYAMHYVQTLFKNKTMHEFQKEPVTYLFIFPSKNPTIDAGWWKKEKVKITQKPAKVFEFYDNIRIEKYNLDQKNLAVPSDPNLIHTLIFR